MSGVALRANRGTLAEKMRGSGPRVAAVNGDGAPEMLSAAWLLTGRDKLLVYYP
jgi:hypothetical protein